MASAAPALRSGFVLKHAPNTPLLAAAALDAGLARQGHARSWAFDPASGLYHGRVAGTMAGAPLGLALSADGSTVRGYAQSPGKDAHGEAVRQVAGALGHLDPEYDGTGLCIGCLGGEEFRRRSDPGEGGAAERPKCGGGTRLFQCLKDGALVWETCFKEKDRRSVEAQCQMFLDKRKDPGEACATCRRRAAAAGLSPADAEKLCALSCKVTVGAMKKKEPRNPQACAECTYRAVAAGLDPAEVCAMACRSEDAGLFRTRRAFDPDACWNCKMNPKCSVEDMKKLCPGWPGGIN